MLAFIEQKSVKLSAHPSRELIHPAYICVCVVRMNVYL